MTREVMQTIAEWVRAGGYFGPEYNRRVVEIGPSTYQLEESVGGLTRFVQVTTGDESFPEEFRRAARRLSERIYELRENGGT